MAHEPPTPEGATSIDDVVRRLRELRAWAGITEREVHRRVVRRRAERAVAERPVFDTVRRCFVPGRARLDIDLVADIASVLLGREAVEWRHALQVIAGWSAAAMAVATADTLPALSADFSGREAESRLLDRLIADGAQVISVEGMPGVGKSTLATRFAHQAAAQMRARVLWADLRGHDPKLPPADPAAVLDGFVRHLGGSAGGSPASTQYQQLLRGRPTVIVLDDAATGEQVGPLLPGLPDTLTLITSRSALCGLARASHVALDVFTPDEAVDFLGKAIGADRVAAEPRSAAAIAETTGYLPLTLGLAAGRIAATDDWTLSDHLDRLRHLGPRLDDRTNAEFDQSYRALATVAQRVFRRLSLHPGRDIDAHAVAALDGSDVDTARANLDALVTRHLLRRHVPGRFRLHDLLWRYAANQAVEHDSASIRHEALARLRDYHRHAAACAMDRYAPYHQHKHVDTVSESPSFPDRATAIAWLDAERANLVAASRDAAPDYAAHMSGLLTQYLEGGAHYRDAEALHGLACRSAGPNIRASALRRVSVVQWKTGRYRTALEHLGEALALFRACGDREGEGKTLNNLGSVHRRMGHYRLALDCYPAAIAIAADSADLDAEANARNCLGILHARMGKHGEAEEQQRAALAIYVDIGNQAGLCRVWSDLGDVLGGAGRYAEALDCYPQAVAAASDVGDQVGLGLARARTGLLRARLGLHAAARDNLEQASRLAEQTGDCGVALEALHGLGTVLRHTGSLRRALDCHHAALTIADGLTAPYEQAQAHDGIAACHARMGTASAARTHRTLATEIRDALSVRG